MAASAQLTVDGRKIAVSNLDKVLYPKTGFTKADVINYYTRISPVLLPHLKNRAITLKRYPNGVEGEYFYEKQCPSHRPGWVKTEEIWMEGAEKCVNFCVVNELATLVWLGNLADLELHTSLAVIRNTDRPTVMVFDLDPGEPANIVQCCEVGLLLRDLLAEAGLDSYAKSSGSKGLQMYVPLHTPTTFDATKDYARELAMTLEKAHPKLVVSKMAKALRKGKIFIDWSQNDTHKTTVSVYSLRAKERPTVSTPVTWDEVERCHEKKDAALLVFESEEVLERVEEHGDLFAAVLEQKQKLPKGKARKG